VTIVALAATCLAELFGQLSLLLGPALFALLSCTPKAAVGAQQGTADAAARRGRCALPGMQPADSRMGRLGLGGVGRCRLGEGCLHGTQSTCSHRMPYPGISARPPAPARRGDLPTQECCRTYSLQTGAEAGERRGA
jgi:hypothetical protein